MIVGAHARLHKAITPCPGKRERDLGADLDALKSWGAEAVVTLVQDGKKLEISLEGACFDFFERQDDELRLLGVEDMKTAVESRKMTWFHCPVPDFSAPGIFFEGTQTEPVHVGSMSWLSL